MTRPMLCAVLLAGIALAALPLAAQDRSGPNLAPGARGDRGGVAQMALAQDLYTLGMAQQDPLLVLTAARLAAGVALKDVAREVETRPAQTSEPEEADGAEAPVGAAQMLAAARALAGEDEVLAGLVDEVEAEGARRRTGEASRTPGRLPAGQSDVWKIAFFGNSHAEIAVLGDGDANLDVRVTDENGTLICQDISASDHVYCGFVPAWNGYFHVEVENTGRKPNSYVLLTN